MLVPPRFSALGELGAEAFLRFGGLTDGGPDSITSPMVRTNAVRVGMLSILRLIRKFNTLSTSFEESTNFGILMFRHFTSFSIDNIGLLKSNKNHSNIAKHCTLVHRWDQPGYGSWSLPYNHPNLSMYSQLQLYLYEQHYLYVAEDHRN